MNLRQYYKRTPNDGEIPNRRSVKYVSVCNKDINLRLKLIKLKHGDEKNKNRERMTTYIL